MIQWDLSETHVADIEKLARSFYRHFNERYHNFGEDWLYLCRYVHHLLLHLGNSIRANGPISMMAQWSMENFVGVINRPCNAKDLFAKSVAAIKKMEAAARLCGIERNLHIPHLPSFHEERGKIDLNLCCKSELRELDGFKFRHPRHGVAIDAAENGFPYLRRMMRQYFESSLNISREMWRSCFISTSP